MKTLKTLAAASLMCLPYAAATAAEPMKPSGVMEAMMSNDQKDFFETAASANLFEIEAGKLAQTKATDPTLQTFGAQMVKDHTEASAKLAALASTKSVPLPTAMLKRHQSMYDALVKDKAGKDFDEDFRNKMVMSHKEAVSLFDQTAQKAKDPEVKAFAAMMLPKLQMHGSAAMELNEGH